MFCEDFEWGRPLACGGLSGRLQRRPAGLRAPRRPRACPTESASYQRMSKIKSHCARVRAPHRSAESEICGLAPEQRFDIAPPMHNAKDEHVLMVDTVYDHVFTNREAPRARA